MKGKQMLKVKGKPLCSVSARQPSHPGDARAENHSWK